jgi:hypothetical protein
MLNGGQDKIVHKESENLNTEHETNSEPEAFMACDRGMTTLDSLSWWVKVPVLIATGLMAEGAIGGVLHGNGNE